MLKATFRFGGDNQEVIVKGNDLLFHDISSGMITPITGLRISKSGAVKEFPDLKEDDEWKKKTIERLKDKMKSFETEKQKMEYVVKELENFGHELLFYQRAGFRPSKKL